MNSELKKILQNPVTGNVLTVASGLSFFFNCMLMPLVGRSGTSVPYAGKNQVAFLAALGLTFTLAALATGAKMLRRKEDQSPLPLWSIGLCSICVILFALQLAGLLAV